MMLNIVILISGALYAYIEDQIAKRRSKILRLIARMKRLYGDRLARQWRIQNMPETVHEPIWVKTFYLLALRKD